MARSLIFVSILLSGGLATSVSQGQLFRGNAAPPAAREPARVGLLGGLREAREERFRREEQAAAAAARASAAQRSPAAPRPNAGAQQQPANAAANPQAVNPAASGASASRTSNFRGPNGAQARGQESASLANSKINSKNSLSRATPASSTNAVTPASASAFVPEPVGSNGQGNIGQDYDGPGVVIRLPKEALSVVNFLVDETNTGAIRPGEQQVLDSKSSYVVRYSRGVTRDGRSFGESRYTISEGRYRFELTATGWELYREADAETNSVPLNPLDLAENQLVDRQSSEQISAQPSSQSELQRTPPSRESISNKPAVEPVAKEPKISEPKTSEPAANEEVLPAPKPRSILE